ncbi:NAD(P)-binding protein [Hypoxylon trugodes]|uniref:NAD(P)-binding protein n=1 Tax=Hypoxylon trugodes TaxID=326681 RepID=UPI00218D6F04|nr:NAD(P)-binding protein [Hypoxylon trugodes]KAI1389026.1 NAD(P)-binding protein [Hypoxylon trugodes]
MGSFTGFLYRQFTFKPKPLPTTVNLKGKTALVTGASGGLGLEACLELAAHGVSRIILGVRDPSKSDAAKPIQAKNPNVDVQVWQIEQESFASIKEFADRAAGLDRLDIVILNAGVKNVEYVKSSKGGHELNVQVNHLGTALLSLLLLGPLRRTGDATGTPARLTIVSSENHFWVKLKVIKGPDTLARMDDKETFGKDMDRYNLTKLLNVLWMRELSTRASRNVVINAVNPGFCRSGLHRSHSSGASFANMVGWTATQGGHALTDAATQHPQDHGAYISEQTLFSPSSFVLSKEGHSAQVKIWNETIELLTQEAPSSDLLSNL